MIILRSLSACSIQTNLQCSITSYDSVFKKQSMAVSKQPGSTRWGNLIIAPSSTSALRRVEWKQIIRYVTQNLAVFIHEQRKRKIWWEKKKVTNGKMEMAWSERIKDEMLINEYLQVGKGRRNRQKLISPCASMVSLPFGNWMAAPNPPSLTGAELSIVASSAHAGRTSRWMMSFSWQ